MNTTTPQSPALHPDGFLDGHHTAPLAVSPDWRAMFADPPVEFRPVPFWSWNEWLEPLEVVRQVGLMKEAGWGGAFLHSRIGLLTPYLGEEWFQACGAALQACRENGLIAWFYDEDKWPSGFSGGSVPLADPDFRHKALIARPADAPTPPDCTPLGASRDGIQVYRWLSPLGDGWFNGTTYADLLSRPAMRHFLDEAYEPYFERFGDDYGSLVVAQFTDEPCSSYRARLPKGAIPYTDELRDRFEQMHGYNPLPQLALLFGPGQGAEKFRLHYHQTIADLFEKNFTAQLGQWCDEHGIALTGHYILEGSLQHQMLWGTQIMPHYRHQGIPGIDHLGRQIEERISAKQCQSVANQYGKKRVLSELYGVAGGGLSFEDRWWIACQQLCLGVNVLNPHLSLYTMAGCRKRDYPQNLFYQQPWWTLNRVVDEPLSRLCVALSQGQYHAEFLVLHPMQSAFVLWQAKSDASDEAIGPDWHPVTPQAEARITQLDADFKALTDALLGAQRTFDYADETILADVGRVEVRQDGARLRIGEMAYPVVLLPSLETIAATTLQQLQAFQDAGGLVLRCGDAPRWLDGEASEALSLWLKTVPFVAPEALRQTLRDALPSAVELLDGDAEDARMLWTHLRDLPGGERLVFLTNLSRERDFHATLHLQGAWTASRLDAVTGGESPLEGPLESGGLRVLLPFARTQSHLLHLRPAHTEHLNGTARNGHHAGAAQAIELPADSWRVERLDDNALTLDYASWRTDGEWSPRPMPVIAIQEMLNAAHYHGPLSLRYTARVDDLAPERKVHLVVERPEHYRVTLNGEEVRDTGLPFWRDIRWMPLDVSGRLQPGDNIIEMHCGDFHFGDPNETLDQPARYGTEIEAVYLVGDFGVSGEASGEATRQSVWDAWGLPLVEVRCLHDFTLTEPRPLFLGDVTVQGLPFYAGRLRLSATLPPCSARRLRVEQLDGAVAEVAFNGESVGHLWAHPLEVELPAAARQGGEIAMTLFGTLRNLLGPHHHVEGELCQVGPDHFKPTAPPATHADQTGEAYAAWLQGWMNGESSPADWRDRYCLLAFGDLGKIWLHGG